MRERIPPEQDRDPNPPELASLGRGLAYPADHFASIVQHLVASAMTYEQTVSAEGKPVYSLSGPRMVRHLFSKFGSVKPVVRGAGVYRTCSGLVGKTVSVLSHKARALFAPQQTDYFGRYLRHGYIDTAAYLQSGHEVGTGPAPTTSILAPLSVSESSISAELPVPDTSSEQPSDTSTEQTVSIVTESSASTPTEQPVSAPTQRPPSPPRRPQRPRRANPLFGKAFLAKTLAPVVKANAAQDKEAAEALARGAALAARAPAAAEPETTAATAEPEPETPVASPRGPPARKVQGSRQASPARSPRDAQPRTGAGLSAPAAEAAASMPPADAGAVAAGPGEAQAVVVLTAPAAAPARAGPGGRLVVKAHEDLNASERRRVEDAAKRIGPVVQGGARPRVLFLATAYAIESAVRTNTAVEARKSGKKNGASGAQGSCASLDKCPVKDA